MTGKAQNILKDGDVENGQGITFQTNAEEELAFTTEFPVTRIKISHLIQKFGKFQRVEKFLIIIIMRS